LPKYFLDTSALAKVYRKEAGSDFVDRIVSKPGSQHLMSRLTIVEMESVFALKARAGEIDQKAVLIARRRLEADLGHRRLLVAAVNDEHFRGARQLLFKHGAVDALRTLDALQLSVALGRKRAELVTVFG
jgi:predicted nucleic acid-binding protein